MKTYMIFLVFLASLISSACATRRTTVVGLPPRPLTQAEYDVIREGAAVYNVGLQEKWKQQTELECPEGGREDVIIGRELGKNAFRVSGSRTAKYLLARNTGLVTAFNTHNEPALIKEGGRMMVRNMCPHGSITFAVVLPVDAGMFVGISPTWQNYTWTAERVFNGKIYVGVSPSISLWSYDWQRERKAVWTLEMNNVTRELK